MKAPFFTIIVPTYNRARFIEKTLQSCLQQDCQKKYEIIVVDDGSTDNTCEILKKISDPKIHYSYISNSERGAARNYGTLKSRGEYITFLDSDDILHSNHLSHAKEMIEKYNSPPVLHLGYQIKNEKGQVLQKMSNVPYRDLNKAILHGNYMSCMGVFVRNDIAKKHLFSEARELSGTEDWLLWLQLAARYPFKYSEKITASMIDHDNRSIKSFSALELDLRTKLLCETLADDKEFIKTYGSGTIRKIKAHMLTYSGLHLMLSKKKRAGWIRFLNGVKMNPGELFTRRALAVLKHSLK